jgi:hypothetical protein
VVSEQRVVEQVSDLIEVIQASGADRKEEGEETKSGRP